MDVPLLGVELPITDHLLLTMAMFILFGTQLVEPSSGCL
jgi:hypothetical protein